MLPTYLIVVAGSPRPGRRHRLFGRELFYADLESRKVTHRIVMRPRSLDAQKQRIMFGDRLFKIQYVRDPLPGAMRGYIEVMVTE